MAAANFSWLFPTPRVAHAAAMRHADRPFQEFFRALAPIAPFAES